MANPGNTIIAPVNLSGVKPGSTVTVSPITTTSILSTTIITGPKGKDGTTLPSTGTPGQLLSYLGGGMYGLIDPNTQATGLVLTSPNSTNWVLSVTNDGALVTTSAGTAPSVPNTYGSQYGLANYA